jgi:hypothetical protein
MRLLASVLALAAAAPALSQGRFPPPPPGPYDPPGESAPSTIGEAPVAAAGAPAAALHPDEAYSSWRSSLATGVAGKVGGMDLSSRRDNPHALLYFGAQADGVWTEGHGRAARLRLRLFTGGEREIYAPSEGDLEAAFMLGRRAFRFVVGRVELGRYPTLGVEALVQAATLPCFEGSLLLAGDAMRLQYYLSPVEATWVYYYGGAHIRHTAATPTESDRVAAASAARLRYTVLLPAALVASVQGDLMKAWARPDMLLAAEGSVGYQALEQAASFNVAVRWSAYTRRLPQAGTSARESELTLLVAASLLF